MEIIIELLFGGLIKASKSRKVPLPVRVILTLLIDLFMLGISAIIIVAGITALGDLTAFGVTLIVIGALMLLGWLRVIAKRFIGKTI